MSGENCELPDYEALGYPETEWGTADVESVVRVIAPVLEWPSCLVDKQYPSRYRKGVDDSTTDK